jgi:hypothetical protein
MTLLLGEGWSMKNGQSLKEKRRKSQWDRRGEGIKYYYIRFF